MSKPKPLRKPPKRPCPPHQWKFPATTNDHVEHECKKCGKKTKRPKGKTLAVAAVILAALLPVSAAKCGGGQHQGLPVHTRNWWIQNLPPTDYIVFGPGRAEAARRVGASRFAAEVARAATDPGLGPAEQIEGRPLITQRAASRSSPARTTL